jgi:hypothetical protein
MDRCFQFPRNSRETIFHSDDISRKRIAAMVYYGFSGGGFRWLHWFRRFPDCLGVQT